MASDVSDVEGDYLGPDLKLDMINLSPASGLNVSSIPRSVTTVPKDIQPDVTSTLLMPLSTTAMPKVAELQSFAPQPGQPVDLSPPNPIKMVQAQEPRNNGKGLFGSNAMIIPDYKEDAATKPTPDTGNPLDLYEQNQREIVKRKTKEAQSPFMQFFYRSEAEKAQEEIGQGYKNIQEVQQQRQTQKTNQQMADNFGLTRKMPSTADAAAIHEEALREWRENGNIKAYQALHGAGQGARADLYKDEAMTSLGKKTGHAAAIIDRLGNAQTDVEYNKLRNEIVNSSKDSKHDYASLGLNENSLPKTRQEWQKNHGAMLGELNKAATMVETYKQQQHQLSMAVPVEDEKVAKSVTDTKTFSNGEVIPNTTAHSLPGAGGVRGALAQPGSKDIANFASEGPGGWNNSTPQNVKTVTEQMAGEEFKGALGKYKMVKDFAAAANNNKLYTYAGGVAYIEDALGAIGRDVAEGSKAAGSIGLVKILEQKFGTIGNWLNVARRETSEYKKWVDGGEKGAQPRLSANTIEGIKYVANFKMETATKELSRLEGPVGTAGRYGIGLSKVGLDKETQELLKPAWDQAVQRTRMDYDKYPSIIKGDQRVILPQGSDVKGMVPAGSYAASIPTNVEKPPEPVPLGGKDVPPVAGPPAGSVPPAIRTNPVGQQVYAAAGQVAHNITQNPTVSSNAALIATSSAQSESAFNPNATHDVDKTTGKPIGQGLYGHNADRLKEMQRFAGMEPTGKPGAPIPAATQAQFFTREMMDAAKTDPFIAKTLNDPKASAEDLTRVQMRLERPEGYKKGQEEKAPSWNKRLAATQTMMQKQEAPATAVASAAPTPGADGMITTPAGNKMSQAEYNYYMSQSQRMAKPEILKPVEVNRNLTPDQAEQNYQQAGVQMGKALPAMAPTIGAAAGGLVGSAAGPVGTVGGAAVGGAAGGAVKNYFTGAPEDQNVTGYAKAAGKGMIEGAPAMIPGVGPAAMVGRAVASGASQAALKGIEGGTGEEMLDAGAKSLAGGIFGEAFGRGLGMTGHKVWQALNAPAQNELIGVAKILATQEPKIADATGKLVENKAYTKAIDRAKELHQDPDNLAYNYAETKKVVDAGGLPKTRGEVEAQRPGAIERERVGQKLEDVKNFVSKAAEVQGVKFKTPAAAVPDGPVSAVLTKTNPTGKLPAEYLPHAEHAEGLMVRPTKNAGEAWGNAAEARTYLLETERDAIRAGDTVKANAMRDMADKVRGKQEEMVRTLLPKNQSDALLQHLKNMDVRYRKAVMAGGDDMIDTIAKGGQKGRETKAAVEALNAGDPAAQRALDIMVRDAQGAAKSGKAATAASLAGLVVMLHLPVVGGALTTAKLGSYLRQWHAMRGAGSTATFGDLVKQQMSKEAKGKAGAAGATVGAGAGVQAGDALLEQTE